MAPLRLTKTQEPAGNGDYTADSIKVLGGMEAVRKRPAMYIGSTGEMGLHHLVYEVVDNSVDEALAGYADKIEVTIHIDNSITVVDNGRGIPVDSMDIDGEKVPAAQVVMTKLHAGGKFDSSSYKVSGGLHGVGVSCVNALSEELDLEIWRDGFTWEQTYSKGEPTSKLKKAGAAQAKTRHQSPLPSRQDHLHRHRIQLRHAGAAPARTGVSEQGPADHAHRRAHHRRQDRRGQVRGVQIQRRHRGVHQASEPRQAGACTTKPIYMEAERSGVVMEIGLQYNDAYSESVFSFANNINTVDGGTHLSGFRMALTRTINYAGQQMGLFKDVKENLTGDDVREGLVAVISVKLPQPQFEGQTKGKLNSDIAGIVQAFVNERLGAFSNRTPRSRARSSTKPSKPPAPAKPRAKPATSPAAKARSMAAAFPANWPIAPNASPSAANCSWSRANPPAAPPSRDATAVFRPSCR